MANHPDWIRGVRQDAQLFINAANNVAAHMQEATNLDYISNPAILDASLTGDLSDVTSLQLVTAATTMATIINSLTDQQRRAIYAVKP